MARDDDEFVPNPDQPIHQGKWTPEEEDYVNALIEEFKSGLLPLAEGTSLRTFLSKMLNCQPMRISKKFVGSNYNGKQVYVRRKNTLSNEEVCKRRAKLQELERKFLAKASPMSAMDSAGHVNTANLNLAQSRQGANPAQNNNLMMGGLPGGLDAAALLAGRSNSKAAAAGRALLLGGSGSLKPSASAPDDGMGTNLAGFSSSELAAELEKRAKSDLQTRSSVENFLGSAAELQGRASVDALLANPFQSHGSRSNLFSAGSRNNLLAAAQTSFHRGSSASNLASAFGRNTSASNFLNATANSFKKNSTNNLLLNAAARTSFHRGGSSTNLASAFGRNTSASLLNASFKKNTSSSILNALASSGALRKSSTSNLANAARVSGASSSAAGFDLQSLLQSREQGIGNTEGRHSAASLTDFLERHNSMDFQSRVSDLMEGANAAKNWSAAAVSGGGSRSNLANLRLSMQNESEGASSVFGNASFGDNSDSRKMELAQLLNEHGMGAAVAAAAAGKSLNNDSLSAEMIENEAMMQQLRNAGFDSGTSPIGEYLLRQQLAAQQGDCGGASANVEAADEAELRHMLNLKRKFLSQESDAERSAKRFR